MEGAKMYGIEKIGSGKKARYAIKEVNENGTNPVNGKAYKSAEEAEAAASALGLNISACGDLWELLATYKRNTRV